MSCNSLVTSITKRLQGKVALITGGASGIGECTARLFAQHGAQVVIADIQDDHGQSLCKDLVKSFSGENEIASYVHCDVTNESHVKDAVDLSISKYGKLDIMFNNAGITGNNSNSTISNTDIEDLKNVFNVNLFGSIFGAKHAARVMTPAKKGCILFTSSMASVTSSGSTHAYTTSKYAVVGLTKNLSVELGKYGIRVNCISPFATATPMLVKSKDPNEKRQMEDFISQSANLKEVVLEARDIAEAALYLGSDESKYVSGLNLVIDGGYSLTNPMLSLAVQALVSASAETTHRE